MTDHRTTTSLVAAPASSARAATLTESQGASTTVLDPSRSAGDDQGVGATPGGIGNPGQDGTGVARQPAQVVPQATKPKAPACSQLPDPTPLRTDRWVDARLRLDHGKLMLVDWELQQTRRPEVTPRKMGRFAAELWIGCELIDRVRFDFPLLGGEKPNRPSHDPNFESGATFEVRIRLPESERATRLELVDRAAERRELFDWPLRKTP